MELMFFHRLLNFRVGNHQNNSNCCLPIYPNVKLFKVEEGDLGHHTKYADKKSVYWETDRHGYRIKAADREDFRIIIVGDSIVAGSGLTQEDTLASALERRLGVGVYPFAPATFSQFAGDARFAIHPPAVVVFSQIERNIPNLKSIKESKNDKFPYLSSLFRRMQSVRDIPFFQSMAVYADRATKMSGINYLNSRLAPVRQPKPMTAEFFSCKGKLQTNPRPKKPSKEP